MQNNGHQYTLQGLFLIETFVAKSVYNLAVSNNVFDSMPPGITGSENQSFTNWDTQAS